MGGLRLWAGFENEIEWRLVCSAKMHKAPFNYNLTQPLFARLGSKGQSHFLANRIGVQIIVEKL
jgi:hypothetical protein